MRSPFARSLALLLLLLTSLAVSGREFTVLTFNVENVFDADQIAGFEDYREENSRRPYPYTPQMLATKVENISRVLSASVPGGPDIIVFNEFEEDRTPESTLADLGAALAAEEGISVRELLAPPHLDRVRGYPVEFYVLKQLRDDGLGDYHVAQASWPEGDLSEAAVHKNVIFSRFPIRAVRWYPLVQARAIVEADLDIDGHSFVVFANHWKSGASNPQMEVLRQEHARVLRKRLDELLAADPRRDILLAGDFNSAYEQSILIPDFYPNAVNHILGSQGDERKVADGKAPLYNLWFDLPVAQRYSDMFRGYWGTLMQNMVTPGLYDHRGIQIVRKSFAVIRIPGLTAHDNGVGTPNRWTYFGGGQGMSDHFPLLVRFRVVAEGEQSDAVMALPEPGLQSTAERERLPVAYDRVRVEALPTADAVLVDRNDAYLGASMGNFYRVAGRVQRTRPFRIEAAGREYTVWSYDPAVMERLQRWRVGQRVRFVGELNEFRGQPQFVIHRLDWVGLPES